MNRQEAINIVKKNWPDSSFTSLKEALEFLIPELISTDNEKIKEAIIKGIIHAAEEGCFCADNYSVKECLAWLEKQGDKKPTEWEPQTGDTFRKKGTTSPTYHLCDKREDGITFGFVENREVGISGGEITIFALRQDYELVERPKLIEDVVKEELNRALQTKGEKKPADKTEPKFHEGDWVVSSNGVYWHIDAIQNGRYEVTADTGQCGNCPLDTNLYRLWTIQEAKDGDVLANDHHIFILKELGYSWAANVNPDSLYAYCGIKPNGNFEFEQKGYCFCGTLHTHPATKEQRDLLFQKMKEAGYEWDADKKELKKIEQKPAWSEEDESWFKELELMALSFSNDDSYRKKFFDWLKYLKERVQPQPKQEWSKEDEKMLSDIEDCIKNLPIFYEFLNINGEDKTTERFVCEAINWFKCLKERYTWKPSDEQMRALSLAMCGVDDPLFSLYQDLKKLKL